MLKEFKCQQCGRCCKNVDGLDVTTDDIKRFKKILGVNKSYYEIQTKIWWNEIIGRLEIDGNENGSCIFLRKIRGQNKYTCKIHGCKPDMCRKFPINKEQLVNGYGKTVGCEGRKLMEIKE